MRIVFASLGSLGDLHPLLALARTSEERGHEVLVAASPRYRSRIEALGFAFCPIRPELEPEPAAMERLNHPSRGPENLLREEIFPRARETYDDLREAMRGADFLVVGELLYVAPLVAAKTGLPWANVILSPTSFLSAHDPSVLAPAPHLHVLRHVRPWGHRAIFALGRFLTGRWSAPLIQLRRELGLPAGPSPVFEGKHSPHLTLALFPSSFATPQPDWPAKVVQTGFPFFSQTSDSAVMARVDAFLAEGEPPLVFTLGSSVVHVAGDFYRSAAEAAQALGRRAILLLGENPVPPDLPSGILALPYAPLEKFIDRAAVLIHQGGIGVCGEALRAGVPSLIIPFGYDQPDNAERMRKLGAAQILRRGEVSRATLEQALRLILAGGASRLPPYAFQPAADLTRAVEALEKVAEGEEIVPDPPPPVPTGSLAQAMIFLRFLRPYRTRFVGAIGTLLVSTSLGLCFPYLTGLLLDAAIRQPAGAPAGWTASINTIALLLFGTLGLQAFLSYFSTSWFYCCGESALVDLRRATFARLIGLPMDFFAQRRVGELISRLTTDLTVIQDTLTITIQQFLRQTLLLTGGLALIMFTSLRLTGLMITTFPVLIVAAIVFGRFIRRYAREAQDRLAEGGVVLEESLHGIGGVKAFGNEKFELDRYSRILGQFQRVILKTARLRALMVSFIIFAIFGSIVLVFWYGARLMQAGELSFGELTRFILYTTFVGGSVASFADVFSQVQKALGATERVKELLEEPPEIDSRETSPPAPRVRGEVSFEQVTFRYPSRPNPVLHDLTLRASSGEKVALVGPSGAGKSTIVALLLQFYRPDAGRILIDGRPAQDFALSDLRANIAIVPQEVLLFGASIEENIRYGRPGASRDEVVAASKQAACHDFIERFPEGYATMVGDRGIKLSGGQRQRIAIARALLKDPAILILDEATSSLDSESERLIQQALAVLLKNRTAFIIAHRLSTVRQADRIYSIVDGRVVESGSHDELMRRENGTYRRLAEMQFGD